MRHWREKVEAEMLGVNVGVAALMAFFPFNGAKNSFCGDLHATGKDGVRFFTKNKVEIVCYLSEPGSGPAVRLPEGAGGGAAAIPPRPGQPAWVLAKLEAVK